MKTQAVLLIIMLAVASTNLLVSVGIPSEIIEQLEQEQEMVKYTIGPVDVPTTVEGAATDVPVSVTVIQGADVPENTAVPKSAETKAAAHARAWVAFQDQVKYIKNNGT